MATTDDITKPDASRPFAPTAGYDTWAVVWRNNKPIAAFVNSRMAAEWIASAPHRHKDVISTWARVGLMREYWAEAQRRSRARRGSHNTDFRDPRP